MTLRHGAGLAARRAAGLLCLLWLGATASAHAQTLSTSDLAGTWALFQLAPPADSVTGATLRSYSGQVTFGADGSATGGVLSDDQGSSVTITSGGLAVAAGGQVGGGLGFNGSPDTAFDVTAARLLTNRHTIVGVASFFDARGFFSLVKLEPAQSFTIDDALAGTWSYHELNPVDQSFPGSAGAPSWSRGLVTFHTDDTTPGQSCAQASLERPGGSARAAAGVPGSFGCATLGAAGAVTGTNAGFNAQMTTSATSGERDLILGLTAGADTQFPGMAVLSKVASGVTFAPADLAGSWSVYLQRIDADPLTANTVASGQFTFSATGAFAGGSLVAPPPGSAAFVAAPASTVTVAGNGSVTARLLTTSPSPARYVLRGALRAGKDVIIAALTVEDPPGGSGAISHGLVTLVRDVTLFDLSQPAYTVSEGNGAKVTVLRSGSLAGIAKVTWTAAGGADQLTGLVTGVLTFPAGSASQTFTVMTAPNSAVDGNRSVTLTLSNPTGASAVLGPLASAPLTIVDEDRAGTFRLSAAGYTVAETAKTAPITIQRAAGSGAGIVVTFALTDGTAMAGRDYTLPANNSTTVTFAATDTAKTVQVPILDNALVDGTRTFTFALTNVSANGVLAPAQTSAPVTITDNEVGGTLQFSAAAYAVLEGNTSTITVVRGPGGAGGVLVDFAASDGTAQAGQSYAATSGTLSFGAGNVSAAFPIQTLSNSAITGDTTVVLTLSNPRSSAPVVGPGAKVPVLGALKSAVLTIRDAQKGLQFSSSNYSVREALTTAMISVVRTGPLADTATVRYSTSDGAGADAALAGVHYTPASGILTFGPGIAAQSFAVKILPDKVATGPKTILLLLSGASSSIAPPAALGPRSSAVLTILNTDAGGTVAFSAASFSGTEGGNGAITVTRTGGAGAVSVDFATSDQPCAAPPCPGLAQSDLDYNPMLATLTFGPGETSKTILIPLLTDGLVEGNETFLVTLSNPQGGATLGAPSQALVTIADKNQGGVIQLAAAALTAAAPASGNASVPVMVTRTGTGLGEANVLLMTGAGTAVPGVHYLPVASTIVFGEGQTSRLVPIMLIPDGTVSGNLTLPILLSNASAGATLGATPSALLTIVDAQPSLRFSAPAYTVTEGGVATITVLRGGPLTGTVTVAFATADGSATAGTDYTARQSTLTFAPGVASQTFTVNTVKRAGDPSSRTVILLLDSPTPTGVTVLGDPATLTIVDNDGPGAFQFQAPSYSVTEGGPAVTVTVTRTGGVGGTVVLPWTSTGSSADFTPTFGTLTFAPGQASRTFTVTAVNNTILDGNRAFTLALGTPSAGGALGNPSTAALNVLDNDSGGAIRFASASHTVAENVAGGVFNVPVTRAGTNLASGILATYTISGDTSAIASPLSGPVTFGAGAISAVVPLTILNGAQAQLDRRLTLTLSDPRSSNLVTGPGAPTLGTPSSTTVTITDSLPRVQFSAASFTVIEGEPATIGITRTGPTTGTVTVQFATVDGGSAVSGVDYTPVSRTLTVTSGAATTAPVVTVDDGVLAGSRTVLLALDGATGASIGNPATATLTIQERQSAGTVQFGNATASVLEGGVVRVTVTRTGANLVGGVSVGWSATGGTATPGDDFTPSSGTLSFGPGVTSQSVDITTLDDGLAEGTETIVLSLEAPTGGAVLGSLSQMTVFIVDRQQTIAFAAPTAIVGETTPSAALQILRAGVPSGPASVRVQTFDATALGGQDYTPRNDIVTFQPGEIARTFVIPILTQNAASRNGNRALTVALSEASAGVSLGSPNASTLTIMDFRPDLVITSVSAPTGALTGKAVPTPSTVKNIGPVAAPPFQVGIFMVRSDDPGALAPGAGSLVTVQSVAGLGAGASAAFPTQITLEDDFPSGDYFLSAVANFSGSVAESDTTNNGLSSAPTKISIDRSLTKFKSASASFSQTSVVGGPVPGRAPRAAGPCDLEGSVDLTGTFAITSQTRNIATGKANLTGTLSGFAVQYLIAFTAQLDRDPTADSVFGTLDSVVFRVLGTSITGSGNGSFTGSLDNGFNAALDGQFATSTGGACAFAGTLSAEGQTSFQLRYSTSAQVGGFGFDPNPAVTFPVASPAYAAVFKVFIDADFPDPSTVLFTGPSGSGLNRTPADPVASGPDPNRRRFMYVAPPRTGAAPGGTYSVIYKGETKTFTLPPYNPASSLVVIYPTVTLVDFGVARIDWVYRSATGANLSVAPSFITGVTVRLQVQNSGNSQPVSPNLSPSVTSFDLTCGGLCSTPTWSQVESITFQYTDVVGNQYEIVYPKSYVTELGPRLTNTYSAENCSGANPACSRVQRLFVFTTGVPAGSVSTTSCAAQQAAPPFDPFIFSIANQSQAGVPPYGDPTCVDRIGTTRIPGTNVLTDVYGKRTDLDVPPDNVPYPPGLGIGNQFLFRINRVNGAEEFDVRSVDPPEPDRTTDVIVIPNPATPALKPSGFTLADAKLGQAQTISWTAPPFSISELFIEAVVDTTVNGGGFFCPVQGRDTQLDPAATQGTFTLPPTCNGQAVKSARVCAVYLGEDTRARTEACWQWR